MATTFLEQTRALHEDLERLERLIVKDYQQEAKSHKDKLMQNHRVRKRIDEMQETARKLLRVYEDGSEESRHRKEEIAALGATNPTAVYSKFYDRLKELREYHKRFPALDISGAEDDSSLVREEPRVEFSGEEGLGRYLDLHEHHRMFANAKFGRQLDYLAYLAALADWGSIPKPLRLTRPYREYLQSLLSYLLSFYERTQPLAQLDKQLERLAEEIRQAWPQGQVAGWEDRGVGSSISDESQEAAKQLASDLEAFESVDELETMGAEQLKDKLAQLGLKCGGTVRQRAERLYALRGKSLAELDLKLFARGKAAPAARSEKELQQQEQIALEVALLEARVGRLVELLANVVSDTRGRVEKKQAQTYEEMLAELEEGEEAGAEEEEEDDEYVYNPLRLPLGWDGKPIPYWLYKLHGLNQEFKCEICGNYSYWGRRAFERHFKEWRHINGMKSLGLPNNKDFFEVTQIEDALALWKNIQERNTGGFNPALDEELEDDAGNVYSRKVYDDLQRQGLL